MGLWANAREKKSLVLIFYEQKPMWKNRPKWASTGRTGRQGFVPLKGKQIYLYCNLIVSYKCAWA